VDELLAWQVSGAALDGTAAVFLPCPPVTRGQEVSADAMTHPRCRVVEAKAWLLHVQNAVLEWCLNPAP
jgi:ornithine carbamoyltransferase